MKDHYLEIIGLLTIASTELNEHNQINKRGLIDPTSPEPNKESELTHFIKEPLAFMINSVVEKLDFNIDKNGNAVMNLSPEQTAIINRFSYEHPKEAEKLFPKGLGISLSLEKNQLILSNYHELETANQDGDKKIGELLKSFQMRQQAINQLMNGDPNGAAKSIDQVDLQEKFGSIIQAHGIENLRPKDTQLDGGHQHTRSSPSSSL